MMETYALVTGASSGIGLQYAHALARDYKYNLVIVSNQQNEIMQTAEDIRKAYGVKVDALYMDLASDEAPQTLYDYCVEHQYTIDVLINNAGIYFFDNLLSIDAKRIDLMLNLHIRTVTQMTRLFAKPMAERGYGRILNMSSMSAWMAMPGIQCYNATKAYLLNFSKSMWYELKPKGVTVTAITPGAIDTPLYGLAPNLRRLAVALHVSMPPAKLVKKALKKMFAGKKQAMPGFLNHLFVPLIKHLPDWVVFFVMKHLACYNTRFYK